MRVDPSRKQRNRKIPKEPEFYCWSTRLQRLHFPVTRCARATNSPKRFLRMDRPYQ